MNVQSVRYQNFFYSERQPSQKRVTAEKKRVNYYPFGLKHKGYNNVVSSNGNSLAQKYKFNGKEHQDELGLNLYHYGARFYDPALGQFTTIDPKAESFGSQGGYVYAANNPVAFHEKNGENPIYGILRWIAKKATKYATKRATKSAQRKILKKKQKSFQKNVKEHVKKLDEFRKDPYGKTSTKKMKEFTKDNPTKEVLDKRVRNSRENPLKQQIKKNQKNLDKTNKQLKELDKTSNNIKTGTVVATSTVATKKAVSAVTPDINVTIDAVKTATTLPGQIDTRAAANAGKKIIGNNAVGRFVDNWINPFGIVDDVKTLMIIGIMSTSEK